jgi:hypothetical protein
MSETELSGRSDRVRGRGEFELELADDGSMMTGGSSIGSIVGDLVTMTGLEGGERGNDLFSFSFTPSSLLVLRCL